MSREDILLPDRHLNFNEFYYSDNIPLRAKAEYHHLNRRFSRHRIAQQAAVALRSFKKNYARKNSAGLTIVNDTAVTIDYADGISVSNIRRNTMADSSKKTPGNADGAWFVDTSCISCGLCTDEAPDNFGMSDTAFVKKQPAGAAEESACGSAAENCPVQAIGKE